MTLYSETLSTVKVSSEKRPIVSISWVSRKRIEYGAFFKSRRRDQTRGILAYLNRVIFFALKNAGAIAQNEDGTKSIIEHRLRLAIAASLEGGLSITMTTLWQGEHNLRHNPGAPYSPGAIRRTRQELKDQGILDFEAVASGSTWEPPVLTINFLEALLFAEAAEAYLMSWSKIDRDGEWTRYSLDEDLPEHKHAIVRMAFNATFQEITEYRRESIAGEGIGGAPDTPKVPLQKQLARMFEAKIFAPDFWKDLFKKHVRSRLKKKAKSTTPKNRPSLIPQEQLRLVPF